MVALDQLPDIHATYSPWLRTRLADLSLLVPAIEAFAGMFRPAHIRLMPRPQTLTPPPDLFGYIRSAPAAQKLVIRPPPRAPASPQNLPELSDSDLARWAAGLVQELERRMAAGQGCKP